MSDEPAHLSREEVVALKFAAHRQLARWAKTRPLPPRQQARRAALVSAIRTLEDPRFVEGVDLREAPGGDDGARRRPPS